MQAVMDTNNNNNKNTNNNFIHTLEFRGKTLFSSKNLQTCSRWSNKKQHKTKRKIKSL